MMNGNHNASPAVVDERFRFPALKANRKRAMTTNDRSTRTVTAQPSHMGLRRESLYEDRCKFHGGPMASLSEDIEEEGQFAQDSTHREALFRAVDALAIVEKNSEPAIVNVNSDTNSTIEDVRQLRSAVDTAWSALYNAHPRRARAATISTGRTIKRKSVPLPDIDGWSREKLPVDECVNVTESLAAAPQTIAPSLLFDQAPTVMPAMNPFSSEMRELRYCDLSADIAPDQRTAESHAWLTSLGVGKPASSSSSSIAELIGMPISSSKKKADKPSRTLRRTGNLFGRFDRQSRKGRRGSMLITDDMLDDAAATSEENESDLESTPPLADTCSLSSTPGAHSPELRDASSDGMFGLYPINSAAVDGKDRAVQSPMLNRKTLEADNTRWRPVLLSSRETSGASFNLLGMHMGSPNPASHLSSNRF